MYLLKICQCCDRIIGELEEQTLDRAEFLEVRGNTAYALCSACLEEMNRMTTGRRYYH